MKKRHAVEEIVRLVREAEALMAQGKTVEETCRELGLHESTLVRWRHQYGGLSTPEAKELKRLQRENEDLKDIVAELELAKRVLQEAVKRLGKA